jgi:hypothetical protein
MDLASADDLGPLESIAARAQRGTHLALRFPAQLDEPGKAEVIERLSAALPEHSVFESGRNGTSTCVTVMPVVPRHEVVERRAEIQRAIEDYRRTCASLIEGYRRGSLPQEWEAAEHGGECRFENERTGQVVEAPFRGRGVDPYFFAIFVQTTPGHARVAELIKEDFHDAARILDVIEAATAGGAEPGNRTLPEGD